MPHSRFLKRLGSDGAWDVPVCGEVQWIASELLRRAHSEDPFKVPWFVQPDGVLAVWTDASSIAMRVVIQVNETLMEDASWLRKKYGSLHINVAELVAVGRGINLSI